MRDSTLEDSVVRCSNKKDYMVDSLTLLPKSKHMHPKQKKELY